MRKIAVIGFSSFEFGAFEAFFKMVGLSKPNGFVVSNRTDSAQLVFVNGTHPSVVNLVESLPSRPKIVIVGADALGTKHPLLPRPIRLTSALALANQLVPPAAAADSSAPSGVSSSAHPSAVNSAGAVRNEIPISPPARPAPLTRPEWVRAETRPSPPVAAGLRNAYVAPPQPQPQMQRVQPVTRSPQVPSQATPEMLSDDDSEILVVDDSDIALRFMQDHLGAFGFNVHLATSGEECLMMLNQKRFKCVFLDVMMSGIDGYQTCRMIKQRKYPSGAAPTVIMMTSRSGAIDRVRGALAGCDGYLVKPVDEGKLIKALFQHRVSSSPVTASRLQSRLSTLTR